MTDVAKAAGVSQSTVSMVLNSVPGSRLSADTRSKVIRIAADLGYCLPGRASSVPAETHRRAVIGYVVDEISTSPHPVVSVDGARNAAWEHDCVMTIVVTHGNAEQEAAAVASLRANPALLGIIYSTIFTRRVSVPECLRGVPAVLLNCHDGAQTLPAIVPGEIGGGHSATEHLIAQGHTRIGFINGEPWMEAAQDRLKGYRRALATADLPFDAALVCDGDWMSGSGFDSAMSLLKQQRPPTAIFCANDLMALGALEAVKQLGLQVPQDVSVMGYDDQEISRHTHPPLTTVVLPNYEMGRVAVETLISLAQTKAPQKTRFAMIKIDCPLVLRQSVARRAAVALARRKRRPQG
jgi:LacI family transcriptional regulator